MRDADVITIGSGIGGATMVAALAPTGVRVLEPGAHLRPCLEDGDGAPFQPGNFDYVGGNTKFYGAALIRYRAKDFPARRHMGRAEHLKETAYG